MAVTAVQGKDVGVRRRRAEVGGVSELQKGYAVVTAGGGFLCSGGDVIRTINWAFICKQASKQ